MSARPVRQRPGSASTGSRLTPHVEELNTTPTPTAKPDKAKDAPPAAEMTTAAAPPPAAASPVEPPEPKTPAKAQTRAATPEPAQQKPVAAAEPATAAKRGRGEQFSTRIDPAVLSQAKAVVMFTQMRPGGARSLAALVESALIHENQRFADEFNNGQPFEEFGGEFRTGRPLGS
jgi:hypothetical protein